MTDLVREATISDVARASGVSAATVSRVLNGNPRVAPELAERVQAAVQEVNYRPNPAAKALRRQRSDLLAAIVPDVRNPFFVRLVEAFEKVAHEQGYSVVLCNTMEDSAQEKSSIDTVIAHRVSGVLLAAARPRAARLQQFERAGIPVVTVDRQVEGFQGDSLSVDNELIGRLAALHLVEQGWTTPLLLNHPVDISPMRQREEGFLRAMAEAGHPVSPDRVARLPFHDDRPKEVVSLIADTPADSVFATTNTLTSEAFVALRGLGRAIGRDIALIGVDDDRWNTMVEPQISVIEQPSEELGSWAGQLLATRAKGGSMLHARIILDPVLRARASTLGPA
ncbi:MAG: LacI family DNA-binding transcriptional regulator [Arachnia sp.]